MHYMDMCAAMSAYKHARLPVVTASVDQLDFMAPAKVGDILILKSSVNYVTNSSMEVGVRIEAENPLTGNVKHTASAYLTFVALLPEFLLSRTSIPFYLGGTALLIVVVVMIDFITQIQSHLFQHQYENLLRKTKLKGRR